MSGDNGPHNDSILGFAALMLVCIVILFLLEATGTTNLW